MIPVVVIPAVSRFDMMEANLAAFDHPVGRLVIVDNSLSGYTYTPPDGSLFASVEVMRPILPLGSAGGWNAGVYQTPEAPWWLLTSTDIGYGPGDLDAIVGLMESADGRPTLVTGSVDDERLLRSAYLAVNRELVEAVGLYDEWAFYPCYYEDDDLDYRCELAGVDWLEWDGNIAHDRSITIRSDERMAEGNRRSFPDNLRRFIEKWGGPPGGERFTTPYGLPVPLSCMKIDLAGRAARQW